MGFFSGFGGALLSAGANILGGLSRNSAARSASRQQMQFQEAVMRHQYQWAMEDMRKAGLNPILAYKQGGAGTASGASYVPENIATEAVSSAMQAKRLAEELDNIRADTKAKKASAALNTAAEVKTIQEGQKAVFDTLRSESEASSADSIARKQKLEADAMEKYGPSALGTSLTSAERIMDTVIERLKKVLPDWLRSSAK